MKVLVKDAVRAAARAIGILDGVNAYLNGEENEQGERDTELLVECFNRVENELALDYLPLVAEDRITTTAGAVEYTQLRKPAARILSVEDGNGNTQKYRLYPDRLETVTGKVKIVYAYTPSEKGLDGESEYQTAVSQRLFVYGMAAEYSLAVGELESASAWDKKYKEAIQAAYRRRPAARIIARRWV